MIKCAALPDMIFNSQSELFKALLENETKIIQIKKAEIQKSSEKGQIGSCVAYKEVSEEVKRLFNYKSNFIYPVINTTKYMDSHDDVHFDGIWDKSAKEQQGKVFYITDHTLKVNDVIAWPQDVCVMVKSVPWSFIGKEYEGETQALIYGIDKDKIVHPTAKEIIDQKRPVQNSVKMQYVKIRLAINDEGDEFKAHKEYYDSRIDTIANKDYASARGFFWGVEEAKIVQEGSMVLFGSNDATPVKYFEAVYDTSKQEPSEDTQKLRELLSNIKV